MLVLMLLLKVIFLKDMKSGADPAAGKGGQIVDQWRGFQGAGPLAGVQGAESPGGGYIFLSFIGAGAPCSPYRSMKSYIGTKEEIKTS